MERCCATSYTNALKQIFKDLKVRKVSGDTADFDNKMTKLRANIDVLDANLLELLGKRMKVADEIGQVKKEANVAVLQNNRWNEIQEKMVAEGSKKGLSEDFIIKLFKGIHQESIEHQEKILNS
jgi:chorismate mutase